MSSLINACQNALINNLALQPHERLLIITDSGKKHIADCFWLAGHEITNKVDRIEIPVPEHNGQEPEEAVRVRMQQADVILMPLSGSLSWTLARKRASDGGARIASMPHITEATILRTFNLDYHKIHARVNRIDDLLDAAATARILTKTGTDLHLDLTGRKGRGRKGGIYVKKGAWGNLPCGEAFIAPVEGRASGVYYVDASHAGVGAVETPIGCEVKDGMVCDITGGAEARQLAELLASIKDPNAYNIAEFGIGCNNGAEICGITLEDEKVLGTCHVALGNNSYFGGAVDVAIHVDGVIKAPTIFIDDRKVVEAGRMHPVLAGESE